jgi:hypothetical protein
MDNIIDEKLIILKFTDFWRFIQKTSKVFVNETRDIGARLPVGKTGAVSVFVDGSLLGPLDGRVLDGAHFFCPIKGARSGTERRFVYVRFNQICLKLWIDFDTMFLTIIE